MAHEVYSRPFTKKGFPATYAVRLDGLKPHHVTREFLALGVLLGYGYSAERGYGIRVSGHGYLYFPHTEGSLRLHYFAEDAQ